MNSRGCSEAKPTEHRRRNQPRCRFPHGFGNVMGELLAQLMASRSHRGFSRFAGSPPASWESPRGLQSGSSHFTRSAGPTITLFSGDRPQGPLPRTQSLEDQGKMDEGGEDHIPLVEAREDASEALEASREALYRIPLAIDRAVISPRMEALGIGWHHGHEAQIQSQLQGASCQSAWAVRATCNPARPQGESR